MSGGPAEESAESFLSEGNRLYGLSRFAEAIGCYGKSLEAKASPESYFNRALARVRVGDYDMALGDIERFLSLCPQDPSGLYVKSLVLGYLNRFREAANAAYGALEGDMFKVSAVRQAAYMEYLNRTEARVLGVLDGRGLVVVAEGRFVKVKPAPDDCIVLSQCCLKSPFAGGYWDMCLAPLLLNERPPRVLLLGVCAGTIARQYAYFGAPQVDAVDLDIGVLSECERFFGPVPSAVRAHGGDGMGFLAGAGERYDVIVFDSFIEGGLIPEGFLADEGMSLVAKSLADDGALVINSMREHAKVSAAVSEFFGSAISLTSGENAVFVGMKSGMGFDEVRERLRSPGDERLKQLGEYMLSAAEPVFTP